jgi:hypothetical protein
LPDLSAERNGQPRTALMPDREVVSHYFPKVVLFARRIVRHLPPMIRRLLSPLLLLVPLLAARADNRQTLDDAWWTGPMLAPSAETLPQRHFLVEPYLYDAQAPHATTYGSLTYINYGLFDRFTVGITPTAAYSRPDQGPASAGVRLGDMQALAQYRLTQFDEESNIPTLSAVVRETFPTGKYDQLGDRQSDGIGAGAYTTAVGIFGQSYFWLGNGRILRTRLDLLESVSSSVPLSDVSVYGTSAGFRGTADPGSSFYADLAFEYSMTREWVLALDLTYGTNGVTKVMGTLPDGRRADGKIGSSRPLGFAPGIEYNWRDDIGVLVAARFIPAGRNVTPSIAPAIALNMVF